MAHEKTMNTWLNDAYAMEQSLVEVLEDRVNQTKDYPDLNAKMQEHLEQTQRHADLIRDCLERRGGDVSEIKAGISNMLGAMQGMISGMTRDNLAKIAINDYTAEHFEIASYTALIAAAREIGDDETARVAEEILEEEKDMAAFLESQLATAVKEIMEREKVAG